MKMFQFVIIAALAVVALASDKPYYPKPPNYPKPAYPTSVYYPDPAYPAPNYQKSAYPPTYVKSYDYTPTSYSFDWAVLDRPTYNDFGHKETRYGKEVDGTYYVYLPDGRKQIVTYKADGYGYVADVKYEGEAKYPEGNPYYPAYPNHSYAPLSYPKSPYSPPAHPKASYPQPSYPRPTYTPPAYPKLSYPKPIYPTYLKPTYRPYHKPSYHVHPRPSYPFYPRPSHSASVAADAVEQTEELVIAEPLPEIAAAEAVVEDIAVVGDEPVVEKTLSAAAKSIVEDITSVVVEPVAEDIVPTATEPAADVNETTTEVAVAIVESTAEPEVVTTDAVEIL